MFFSVKKMYICNIEKNNDMAIIDLHSKPFDEGTITKLEIFESYASEWLPTFVMGYPKRNLWIFDYFAGTGYDKNGIPGSPIRLLQQIKNQAENILHKQNVINICFNEFSKDKFQLLQDSCDKYIKENALLSRLQTDRLLKVNYRNMDFAELFPKTLSTIAQSPSLLYLDQNGMKFLADKYLLELEKLPTTDFLYFLSSSYFVRFGNTEEFQSNMKIDIEKARSNPYKYIHRSILEQLRSNLPINTELKLYPFSIKKGGNIYGIIFGAKHPRAVDKFLKTAWKKNNVNGEANFDIDDDADKVQLDLFEGKRLTKIEGFQNNLKNNILAGNIKNNREAYDFTINNGHIATHANDIVKKMKSEGLISYDSTSPLINYEQAYKNVHIIDFKLISQ